MKYLLVVWLIIKFAAVQPQEVGTFTDYDPQDTYKFIVKVRGEVDTDNPNLSDLRYSLGKTVEF